MLTVPADAYVLSAEAWSPSLRRAGRLRRGTPVRVASEDVATLSDLVLTHHLEEPPPTLLFGRKEAWGSTGYENKPGAQFHPDHQLRALRLGG